MGVSGKQQNRTRTWLMEGYLEYIDYLEGIYLG